MTVREDVIPPDPSYGDRVRKRRIEEGYTIAEAARLLGEQVDTTERGLASIERGEREPRLTEALALRDVLGVDLEPDERDAYAVTMFVQQPDGTMWSASLHTADDVAAACRDVWKTAADRYGT